MTGHGPDRGAAAPVVYGSPAQTARLLASIIRVLENEPHEVFADAEVRQSSHHLASLIERRMTAALAVPVGGPVGLDDARGAS